ncbi:MAG: TonB-dependent receptor [Pseudomonadota bacterium]
MNVKYDSLRIKRTQFPCYTMLGCCYFLLAQATSAQQNVLEEVIVTATKQEASLQDVPIAITAYDEEAIADGEIRDANDVAVQTPSLTIAVNTQPYTAAFRIRGIGTSQSDAALEPSVGIFIDDVFFNRSGVGMSDLTDIERIEVLHGPQGTLYGKNANAGAVSVVTKLPNQNEFEGYFDANLGNYNLQRYTMAASGPINSVAAYRVSASVHTRDGYLDNSVGEDSNGAEDWNVVGKLLLQPNDDLRILFKGSHVERDASCCAADADQSATVNAALQAQGFAEDASDPFDFNIAVNVETVFEEETSALSMVVDYDLPYGALKSITAWGESTGTNSYDIDRSQLDVMSWVDGYSESDFVSQEFRFSAEASETLTYQVGLFYFDAEIRPGNGEPFVFIGEDFLEQANQQEALLALLPPGLPFDLFAQPGDSIRAESTLQTETVALFAQSTWDIDERWRVTGGLRWTNEEKFADLFTEIESTAALFNLTGQSFLNTVAAPIDEEFDRRATDVDWLLNSSFDLGVDTMVFASVATGTKSGGFNTTNGTADQREFDDESTINYELGLKSTLLQQRLRVNASLFFTQIDDYQFQRQLESGVGTIVSNQAEVETSGIDLDVQALPLPNLIVSAGLLYMHKYEITAGPQAGSNLPFTADLSVNLAATFGLPVANGRAYLRADYSYMGEHLTTGTVIVEERDMQTRTVVNAKLGWKNESWSVSLWGKNLSDDEYAGLTASPFAPTDMDAYFLTAPRTYGATLRYDF